MLLMSEAEFYRYTVVTMIFGFVFGASASLWTVHLVAFYTGMRDRRAKRREKFTND
jgi:hypothetical protein